MKKFASRTASWSSQDKEFSKIKENILYHQFQMSIQLSLSAFVAIFLTACVSNRDSTTPKSTPEKQMLGFIEKFDRWDYNGNGVLSTKEIDEGIASLQGTSRAVSYTAAEVVKFYDRNGDKSVSLREAQAKYSRATQNSTDSFQ